MRLVLIENTPRSRKNIPPNLRLERDGKANEITATR